MIVGTFHDTSPMSSEPPPVLSASLTGPCSGADARGEALSRARRVPSAPRARASDRPRSTPACPTFWMFALAASATARLKCCGHAEPSTRVGSSSVFGHHRRALRDPVADRPQVLDALERRLAEVVPDGRGRRHDVRLIAAVGDHVVRALRQRQVLAPEVPADVHQLDRVERAPAAPRRRGRVRALALEAVLHGHEAVPPRSPHDTAEVAVDVREERDVDVLEEPGAHVVRLRADQLFGDARPDADRARRSSRAP